MIATILCIVVCIAIVVVAFITASKAEEHCDLPDEPWNDVDHELFESEIEEELFS